LWLSFSPPLLRYFHSSAWFITIRGISRMLVTASVV
jgi:hypothetical protein